MLSLLFPLFLIGLIGSLFSPWLFLLALPYLLFLCWRKKDPKCCLLGIAVLLVAALFAFLFPKGQEGENTLKGILILRKEKYAILLTLKGRYYVLDKGELGNLFSFVVLRGRAVPLSFSHYESGFDFKGYLKGKGVFYQFYYDNYQIDFHSPFSLAGWKKIATLFVSADAKPLFSSLLFSESLKEKSFGYLSDMGLVSLFSLSGFHVSFLSRMLSSWLKKRSLTQAYLLRLFVVSFFLIISSFRYALKRIFLDTLFALLFSLGRKKVSSLDRISLVAMILLLFEPYSLFSPSFYYAIPFLFFLRLFSYQRKGKKNFFQLTLFLFFYPYRLYSQYGFHLLSPLFQILLLPFSHLLFLLALLSLVCPPLGYLFSLVGKAVIFLGRLSSYLPLFMVSGKPFLLWTILFYLLFALIQIGSIYGYKQESKAGYLFLAGLSFLPYVPTLLPKKEITFIDVDQGSSTLVRNGKENILIDTGGKIYLDMATECLIPYFHKEKITSLTAVIITHRDYDHYGALKSLLEHFPVGKVYEADDFLASEHHTLDIGGLSITNLNDYDVGEDTNSHSGVYRFDLGKKKVLITGDAPKAVEKKLCEDHRDIDVDYLALGHHGSKTSSDYHFLKACSPETAIISCGEKNYYGFPHQETLSALKALKIPYRRTDIEGSITLSCR